MRYLFHVFVCDSHLNASLEVLAKIRIINMVWDCFFPKLFMMMYYPCPKTTLSSSQLWKPLGKTMENIYKGKFKYEKELKTSWQNEKLLIMSNFSLPHNVFKMHLLQRLQKTSVCWKWLKSCPFMFILPILMLFWNEIFTMCMKSELLSFLK